MANYNDNDFLTNEEWAKLIEEKWDALIDAMKDAAVFSATDGTVYTVFLDDDGFIHMAQSVSYTTSYEDVPYTIEIASFQIDPDAVNDELRNVDEESTRETLKLYGMSDKEIEDYIQWFHDEYEWKDQADAHLAALYYYDKDLYDRVFEDTAYDLVDEWYDFVEMLEYLIKELRENQY